MRIPTSGRGLQERFNELKKLGLNISVRRGNPEERQLDASERLFGRPLDARSIDGIDCRNYPGGERGVFEARGLFAEFFGTHINEVLVDNNSTLSLFYDFIHWAYLFGVRSSTPWKKFGMPTILCPVPGYGRFFLVLEELGIKMASIPMSHGVLDMELVEKLVQDQNVVGIICIPKYWNPTGETLSIETCQWLARLRTANPDFVVIWDLAYGVHDLTETSDELPDMFELCKEAGHGQRLVMLGSTSKITFAGSGMAAISSDRDTIDWFAKRSSSRRITPNKLVQLEHARVLKNMEGIREHMARHRAILKPKFDVVERIFQERLGGKDIARWTTPRGGYFVSVFTKERRATKAVETCASLGVQHTAAGESYPYGKNPLDNHFRMSITYLAPHELEPSMEVTALALEMTA